MYIQQERFRNIFHTVNIKFIHSKIHFSLGFIGKHYFMEKNTHICIRRPGLSFPLWSWNQIFLGYFTFPSLLLPHPTATHLSNGNGTWPDLPQFSYTCAMKMPPLTYRHSKLQNLNLDNKLFHPTHLTFTNLWAILPLPNLTSPSLTTTDSGPQTAV